MNSSESDKKNELSKPDWLGEISFDQKKSIERGVKNVNEGRTKGHSFIKKSYYL